MGRRRGEATSDLPPNLYLRKCVYYYRDVRSGIEYSLGKNKSYAITEAINANLAIFNPKVSLLDRINNVNVVTLHEWMDKYWDIVNQRGLRAKTLTDHKSKLSIIKSLMPDVDIGSVTPKMISDVINGYPKPSMAKLLRSTLLDAFNEAIAAGIISNNPVTVTKSPKIKVQRSRLTLEQFKVAVKNAPERYSSIFILAVLTGQRIGDIVNIKWSDIREDKLFIEQSKTGAKIAIPLSLRLGCIGFSVRDVLNSLKNNKDSVCNISAVSLRSNFSNALPPTENKPTFHEIRSLSARLHEEEKGATFAKKLLGHKSMVMTDKYLDKRNNGYTEL